MHVIQIGPQCAICSDEIERRDSWRHEGENGEMHPFHRGCMIQYAENLELDFIPCPVCRESVTPFTKWTRIVRTLRRTCCFAGSIERVKIVALLFAGIVLGGGGGFVFTGLILAGGEHPYYSPIGLAGLYAGYRIVRYTAENEQNGLVSRCVAQTTAVSAVLGLWIGGLSGQYLF